MDQFHQIWSQDHVDLDEHCTMTKRAFILSSEIMKRGLLFIQFFPLCQGAITKYYSINNMTNLTMIYIWAFGIFFFYML
jgi:hypothetical protein